MRDSNVCLSLIYLFTSCALAACDGGRSASANEPNAGSGGASEDGNPHGPLAGNPGAAGTSSDGIDESFCGAIDPRLALADSAELFEHPTVPAFDLYLPPERWTELQANAVDEQYVEALACFEGRAIGKVGLRFKGAYGSLRNCFDSAGNNSCRKLPLKLKFSEYDEDLRFFGMKRLNLHSSRYDATYLREKLSYDLYRSMDVVSPRAAWALVRVNDEPLGLFGMVEQIDGRFTDDRWPDNGDANLYKEAWPSHPGATYASERLTTNDEQPKVGAFVDFAAAIDAARESDASVVRETLSEYVDLDYWARYMAVDDAIAAKDGITAYYTDGAGAWAGNHNFYLYEEASNLFTLIPWDVESTFSRNSGFGAVPRWTETPEDCSLSYPVWGGSGLVLAPGCDPVFRALAADLTTYQQAGQTLLEGPFEEATMLETIEQYAAFIREHAAEDPNGPGLDTFEREVDYLKDEIGGLRRQFELFLSGESWTPLAIDINETTGFEGQSDDGLFDGSFLLCNGNSNVAVSINSQGAIAGNDDLRMSFEYVNEASGWEQWSIYVVPIAGGLSDVSGLSGIRFSARADQARDLRIEIGSPENPAEDQGIRPGWQVNLSEDVASIEVSFDDLMFVDWAIDQGVAPNIEPRTLLDAISGIAIAPQPVGRDSVTGLFPVGTSDRGFVEIDDIEFF